MNQLATIATGCVPGENEISWPMAVEISWPMAVVILAVLALAGFYLWLLAR